MAEHSAVNRRVVGSSPTWGVKTKEQVTDLLFVFLLTDGGLERADPEKCPVDSFPARGFSAEKRAQLGE